MKGEGGDSAAGIAWVSCFKVSSSIFLCLNTKQYVKYLKI